MFFNWERKNFKPMESGKSNSLPSTMKTLWDETDENQSEHSGISEELFQITDGPNPFVRSTPDQNPQTLLNGLKTKPENPGMISAPKPGSNSLLLGRKKDKSVSQGISLWADEEERPWQEFLDSPPEPQRRSSHQARSINFDWRTKVEREQDEKEKREKGLMNADGSLDSIFENPDSESIFEDESKHEAEPPELVEGEKYPTLIVSYERSFKKIVALEPGMIFLVDPYKKKVHLFAYFGAGLGYGVNLSEETPDVGTASIQLGYTYASDPKNLEGLGLEFNTSATAGKGAGGQVTGSMPWTFYLDKNRKDKKYVHGWAAGPTVGLGAGIAGMGTYAKHIDSADFNEFIPFLDSLQDVVDLTGDSNWRLWVKAMVDSGEIPMEKIKEKIMKEIQN